MTKQTQKQKDLIEAWGKVEKIKGAKDRVLNLLGGTKKCKNTIYYILNTKSKYKDQSYVETVLNAIKQSLKDISKDALEIEKQIK